MKKDRILSNILFVFGIILLAYSLYAIIYQTYLTCNINWLAYHGEDLSDMRSLVILDYVTIAVKIVIASYGIYSKKHVDEAINPLFTFTIFYVIFAILQVMSTINNITGTPIKEIMQQYKYVVATAAIDVIVAAFYLVVTLVLKFDDWRSQKDD